MLYAHNVNLLSNAVPFVMLELLTQLVELHLINNCILCEDIFNEAA